jgi:Flp pilus assembly protein TadD
MKQKHAGKRPHTVAAAFGAVLVTAGCATVPPSDAPTAERASRYDGGVEQLLLYCGKLRDSGELTTAASICERAHKIDPTDPRPLLMLGEILTDLERLEQAVEVYQALLEQTPGNTEGRYMLGKTYIAMGHHEMALSELRMALTQNPNDARIYNAMGIARGMLGDQDAARLAFENGLKVAPNDVPLRNNMGLSLVLSGHYVEGIAILEAVVADPAANATSYRNLQLAQGMAQGANGATAVAAAPGTAQIASAMGSPGYVAEPLPVLRADRSPSDIRAATTAPSPQPMHGAPSAVSTEPVMLTEAIAAMDGGAQTANAEPPVYTDDNGAGDDTGDAETTDGAEPNEGETATTDGAEPDEGETATTASAEADAGEAATTDGAEPDAVAAADEPTDETEAADAAQSTTGQPGDVLNTDTMPLPALVASADLSDSAGPAATGTLSPVISADVNPAAPPAPAATPASPAPSLSQVASLTDGGGYSVQLASFRSADRAAAGWEQIRAGASDLLKDIVPVIRRSDLGPERGIFFRLRTKPTSKSAATQLCEALKARQIGCLTIKETPGASEEVPMPAAVKS